MKIKTAIILILCLGLIILGFMYYLFVASSSNEPKVEVRRVETRNGAIEVEIKPGETVEEVVKEAEEEIRQEEMKAIMENLKKTSEPIEEDPEVVEKKVNDLKNILLK